MKIQIQLNVRNSGNVTPIPTTGELEELSSIDEPTVIEDTSVRPVVLMDPCMAAQPSPHPPHIPYDDDTKLIPSLGDNECGDGAVHASGQIQKAGEDISEMRTELLTKIVPSAPVQSQVLGEDDTKIELTGKT